MLMHVETIASWLGVLIPVEVSVKTLFQKGRLKLLLRKGFLKASYSNWQKKTTKYVRGVT